MSDIEKSNSRGATLALGGFAVFASHDVVIKILGGTYSAFQIVFFSVLLSFPLVTIMLMRDSTPGTLLPSHPWWTALRTGAAVISAPCAFYAFSVLPLAQVYAILFAMPLLVTVLSIPILGEKVGPWRLGAVVVGFGGVILMMQAWRGESAPADVHWLILVLPMFSALAYALNQLMTRKLGVASKASAMAVYIQAMFILVSLGFFLVAGDGRFAQDASNESIIFLLRAWVWPEGPDRWLFLGLGLNSAIIGYALGQAYRLANAATVAPFEYLGLPLAVFWGWVIWAEFPAPLVLAGIALIMGSGLFVFLRERIKSRPMIKKRVHRRY